MDMVEMKIIPGKKYISANDTLIAKSFKREFGEFFKVKIIQVPLISKTAVGKHIPIKSFVH